MGKLVLKSQQQILSAQIAEFLAVSGLNDINAAANLLTFLEVSSREDFQQYVQMLNIIRNFNLDTTTGTDLDDKAFEFGLTRLGARKATGRISILREVGFTKVATTFYAGSPSPIAGNTSINVNDASDPLFSTSGTLIIGRGTTNEEEIAYSLAPVDNTNFWTFVLAAPLSNDHGLDETVILKQGVDQLIAAGTIIVVPASAGSSEIAFTTNQDVTILSGEEQLDNVEVTASEPGSDGNIPVKAIDGETAFSTPPFPGARAENDSKYTTGRDEETDDELRDRIKDHIQSLSRGVKTAILNAIIGLVDPDSAKRVISANVVLPVTLDEHVLVFIDDGTGFEPSFLSRGFETVLESATGGEQRLQLDLDPLVKAQVENNQEEPYNMSSGPLTLIYSVGIQSETITFNPGDFEFSASATAEEMVRAINNKATLIEARTSDVGSKIVISSTSDENEDIQVTGGTANPILVFPTDLKSTLFLYKNDQLLSKDGLTAIIDSGNQETYNFSVLGADPWPLTVIVDGKSANTQTVNFLTADFVDASAGTAEEVVAVINAQLAGATATLINNDTAIRLSSNTELSSLSKIQITGGSANTPLGFSTSEISGSDSDYVLNRFLGIVEFNTPLTANDNITTGSQFTRASLRTTNAEFYSLASGETLEIEVDGLGAQTVTFGSTGSFSAAQVAAFINAQLEGATANVRNIGGFNFLEINTNTYTEAGSSLQILSASTATSLLFPLDTLATSQRPHTAFTVSGSAGPYTLFDNQSLVVVIDDDPTTKTFTIFIGFSGQDITAATSTTVFTDANMITIFPNDDDLNDFDLIFKDGANTTSETVTDVTDQGGDTWRYAFNALPANLADFTTADQVVFTDMTNVANNGTFQITTVNTAGNGYVEVTNIAGSAEAGSTGNANVEQKRTVSDYNGITGQLTVSAPFRATPSIGDKYNVVPTTTKNVVEFFNNTKITTLSTKAFIESVEQGTKVQISSKESGSDGFAQVTGGSANGEFAFSTTLFRGLQGYNFYTGLLELVHKTIYGDDRDLDSFPGVGAAGIDFEVLSPTVEEVAFNLDVTLAEGISLSNVEDDIRSAITGYVNSLGVSEDVIIEEIRARTINVPNVVDVVLNSPTININIADREIARTRDSLIIIG